MIPSCPYCSAELGPWEGPEGCLTCNGGPGYDLRDRLIAALETASGPLAWWDVKRVVEREYSTRTLQDALVRQYLANDPRACWSGRGIYSLFRHGMLPGLRDLGQAGGVYIHASDRILNLEEIAFILRHGGYEFTDSSLAIALGRIKYYG